MEGVVQYCLAPLREGKTTHAVPSIAHRAKTSRQLFPGLAVIRRASDSIQIVRVCYYLGPHAYRAPTPLTQYADEQVYTLLIYPY